MDPAYGSGGTAGGIEGFSGYDGANQSYTNCNATGATQSSGGHNYGCGSSTDCGVGTFGQGSNYCDGGYGGCGGGGGSNRGHGGGGGGSGYIGNSRLINKYMYCYNCTISDIADTLTYTATNVPSEAVADYAKSGAGAALISYDSDFPIGEIFSYDYKGSSQTLTIPETGTYKLEVWGAQGGSYSSSCQGGLGGFILKVW